MADYSGGAASKFYVTPFLDQNLSMTDASGTYYYTQDGLGSVRTLTNAAGAMVNKYDYTAFGETYAANNVEGVSQRYTYTGREKSGISGAPMFYRNRMYSPTTGRFLWRDPIGYAGSSGANLYAYAGNNAVNYADAFGLYDKSWCDRVMTKEIRKIGQKDTNDGCDGNSSSYDDDVNAVMSWHTKCVSCAGDDNVDLAYWNGFDEGAGTGLDYTQTGLDVLGMVPVIGEPFDAVNAAVYGLRGDYVTAGLSIGAMIPFAGTASTGGKLAAKYGDDVAKAAAKFGGEVVEGGIQVNSRRAARQAASEMAGDLGVGAKKIPNRATGKTSISGKSYGRKSADGKRGWRDDNRGHRFDSRPHTNAYNKNTGMNMHIYY